MLKLTTQTKAMFRSWLNVFLSAVTASFLALIISTQTLAIDWLAVQAILISGLVAVLPVVKNYFDKSDPRYGKGSVE